MVRQILKWFGYYKVDYGYSCGRHWIEIDGITISQTHGFNNIWMSDSDVHRIGYLVFDKGESWTKPQ